MGPRFIENKGRSTEHLKCTNRDEDDPEAFMVIQSKCCDVTLLKLCTISSFGFFCFLSESLSNCIYHFRKGDSGLGFHPTLNTTLV